MGKKVVSSSKYSGNGGKSSMVSVLQILSWRLQRSLHITYMYILIKMIGRPT